MRLLITSIVDPATSAHSRMHEFAKHLSRKHDVTILSINDSWKRTQKSSSAYRDDWDESASKIRLEYLTKKNLTLIKQEMSSKSLAKESAREFAESGIDLILDYNTIRMGQNVASLLGGVPRIYDLADDLVNMIRISPQLSPITARIGAVASRHFIKSSIKKAHMVTGTSGALLSEYGVPETKRRILPNGVPAEFLEPVQHSDIIDPRNEKEEFLIGYVGVLREWVDFAPVFSAIRTVKKQFPVRLVIVGEEGDAGDFKSMAKREGVLPNVTMVGTVPHNNIPRYLAACDCGIIPFTRSGTATHALPLKLFEYLSLGLPTISSRINAIESQFYEETLIYDSPADLTGIITNLRSSPDLRTKLSEKGRARVRNEYTWEKILPRLDTVIKEALAEAG